MTQTPGLQHRQELNNIQLTPAASGIAPLTPHIDIREDEDPLQIAAVVTFHPDLLNDDNAFERAIQQLALDMGMDFSEDDLHLGAVVTLDTSIHYIRNHHSC